ncbi:Uncharacterised protein [Streptococcus pneumoniae]|nr:Uncharacterised protein [Streptococcus pneumoniae]CJA73966.1 Uncharacterised protein [Streptococcus pneumoniae]CJA89065.1 Uncharacterised protein [Streptococcus pneumoniae]CJB81468.1 Uncharacterised protein [Streptococcus pneumoniae]CJB94516.1 Uncharacterised protein [Streptococcus pneumoniae]
MSLISEIDVSFMGLECAIEKVIWCGLPCLISCIPSKLLYFQAEQGSGPPERYILRKI